MTNKKNLTIDDIARELGVSKTTVSRAISGKGRISDATRNRIMAYIEKHNYRPSAAAKGLAESKTYNIALVLPRSFMKLDLPYIRKSMGSICEEAYQHNYNVLICLCTEDGSDPLMRVLDYRKVDGVILSRTVENDILIDLLKERNIPFATIGSLPSRHNGAAAVEVDNDQVGGCKDFTLELLRRNSGKVAFLGSDMTYIVNQNRLIGFHLAYQLLGLDAGNLLLRTGLNNQSDIVMAVDDMLKMDARTFLCMDDETCLHVMRQLEKRGLRVPQDVAVASLYDSDELAAYNPPISALQFDAAELGTVVCRELLRYLNHEPYEAAPLLGYTLAMRQSTI